LIPFNQYFEINNFHYEALIRYLVKDILFEITITTMKTGRYLLALVLFCVSVLAGKKKCFQI